MTAYRWVGRLAAIVVSLTLITVLIFWPVFFWGWQGWTGLYTGVVIGRFVLFEIQQPTVSWRKTSHKADSNDVR